MIVFNVLVCFIKKSEVEVSVQYGYKIQNSARKALATDTAKNSVEI